MKKLKLDLDQIQVASFRTEELAAVGGTVKGLAATCGSPYSGSFDGCNSCGPMTCIPQAPRPDTESCC